ncbi:hypothetical protein CEUSTIGMA_g5710.t1 [Chlamydomonas eustigma]|uniref:Uncharacterized protein n=1 Tax=Chlamydomonas eustigma TaxID=1157962 RepID=A0A250X5C6_9CHLO|nr:hypothetical protein CEUSTIGMA_g5710.t1 [Chlamydomonas eustigma]|eukprot:GAX78268.1 hypothetical protein CEUSTIGMA_g5710.t1 [Chlamydomonas eustigma]
MVAPPRRIVPTRIDPNATPLSESTSYLKQASQTPSLQRLSTAAPAVPSPSRLGSDRRIHVQIPERGTYAIFYSKDIPAPKQQVALVKQSCGGGDVFNRMIKRLESKYVNAGDVDSSEEEDSELQEDEEEEEEEGESDDEEEDDGVEQGEVELGEGRVKRGCNQATGDDVDMVGSESGGSSSSSGDESTDTDKAEEVELLTGSHGEGADTEREGKQRDLPPLGVGGTEEVNIPLQRRRRQRAERRELYEDDFIDDTEIERAKRDRKQVKTERTGLWVNRGEIKILEEEAPEAAAPQATAGRRSGGRSSKAAVVLPPAVAGTINQVPAAAAAGAVDQQALHHKNVVSRSVAPVISGLAATGQGAQTTIMPMVEGPIRVLGKIPLVAVVVSGGEKQDHAGVGTKRKLKAAAETVQGEASSVADMQGEASSVADMQSMKPRSKKAAKTAPAAPPHLANDTMTAASTHQPQHPPSTIYSLPSAATSMIPLVGPSCSAGCVEKEDGEDTVVLEPNTLDAAVPAAHTKRPSLAALAAKAGITAANSGARMSTQPTLKPTPFVVAAEAAVATASPIPSSRLLLARDSADPIDSTLPSYVRGSAASTSSPHGNKTSLQSKQAGRPRMGVETLVALLKTKYAQAMAVLTSHVAGSSASTVAEAGPGSTQLAAAGPSLSKRLSRSTFSKELKPTFLKLANTLVLSPQDIRRDALSDDALQQLELMLPESATVGAGVGAVWKLLEGLASESWGQIQKLKDELRREISGSCAAPAGSADTAGTLVSAVAMGVNNNGLVRPEGEKANQVEASKSKLVTIFNRLVKKHRAVHGADSLHGLTAEVASWDQAPSVEVLQQLLAEKPNKQAGSSSSGQNKQQTNMSAQAVAAANDASRPPASYDQQEDKTYAEKEEHTASGFNHNKLLVMSHYTAIVGGSRGSRGVLEPSPTRMAPPSPTSMAPLPPPPPRSISAGDTCLSSPISRQKRVHLDLSSDRDGDDDEGLPAVTNNEGSAAVVLQLVDNCDEGKATQVSSPVPAGVAAGTARGSRSSGEAAAGAGTTSSGGPTPSKAASNRKKQGSTAHATSVEGGNNISSVLAAEFPIEDDTEQVASCIQAALSFQTQATEEALRKALKSMSWDDADRSAPASSILKHWRQRAIYKTLCHAGPTGMLAAEVTQKAVELGYTTWLKEKKTRDLVSRCLKYSSSTPEGALLITHVGNHRYTVAALGLPNAPWPEAGSKAISRQANTIKEVSSSGEAAGPSSGGGADGEATAWHPSDSQWSHIVDSGKQLQVKKKTKAVKDMSSNKQLAMMPPSTAAGAIPHMPAPSTAAGAIPHMPAPSTTAGAISHMPAPSIAAGAIPHMPAPSIAAGAIPHMPAPSTAAGAIPHMPAPSTAAGAIPHMPAPSTAAGAIPHMPAPSTAPAVGAIPHMPAPSTAPGAIPHMPAPSTAPGAIPHMPAPSTAAGAIPHMPAPSTAAGAISHMPAPSTAAGAIPHMPAPSTAAGAIPHMPATSTAPGAIPHMPAPSTAAGAIPHMPAPSTAAGAIPHMPAPSTAAGAIPHMPAPSTAAGAIPYIPSVIPYHLPAAERHMAEDTEASLLSIVTSSINMGGSQGGLETAVSGGPDSLRIPVPDSDSRL